ncbi:porin family protein, partial [Escherichia coli]|nr:porin family protein [Escherichia coli]
DFYQHYNVPVRTEVEFYGRGNAESKYRLSYWESAGGAEFDDAQNKLSVNTLMLNAYYDFRNSSAFTPWISAGRGYARVHHKTSYIYTDNSPAGSEVYSASA